MRLQSIGGRSSLLALLVCSLRGGNQVALKFALRSFSPMWTAFGRMLVSAFAVGGWSELRGIALAPLAAEWRPLWNLSLLLVVQISVLHYGADLTSPAYAVVLMNSNPIFANLIAHFFVPEDRLSRLRVLGLGVAFGGICVVFLGQPDARLAPNPTVGNLLVVVAAFTAAARTVYVQHLVQTIDPPKAVLWQTVFSLPLFFVGALLAGGGPREPMHWAPVAGILYQGIVVGAVSLLVWVYLLRKHSPGALTVFSFSVPMFGMLLSAWLHSEAVTPRLILGVIAVISGISLATRRRATGLVAVRSSSATEAME